MADIKRSSPLKVHGTRSSDPYQNLTAKQLELIGAIAMIYNDVEEQIENICVLALQLPIPPREVLSRINGMDGILAIAKLAAAKRGLTDEEQSALCETLGKAGFEGLKVWRDSIVHARIFDVATSIGKHKGRRGAIADVLMSEDALLGVYSRLKLLGRELREMDLVVARRHGIMTAKTDRERELHEARIPAEWARYLSHRTRRLALEPLPEFPPDTLDLGPLRRALAIPSGGAAWTIEHVHHGNGGE